MYAKEWQQKIILIDLATIIVKETALPKGAPFGWMKKKERKNEKEDQEREKERDNNNCLPFHLMHRWFYL